MIKKIMNPISYVMGFCFQWILTFPLMVVAGFIIIALVNVLVFQEPFGMWYVWSVLVVAFMASFAMTVETFEK